MKRRYICLQPSQRMNINTNVFIFRLKIGSHFSIHFFSFLFISRFPFVCLSFCYIFFPCNFPLGYFTINSLYQFLIVIEIFNKIYIKKMNLGHSELIKVGANNFFYHFFVPLLTYPNKNTDILIAIKICIIPSIDLFVSSTIFMSWPSKLLIRIIESYFPREEFLKISSSSHPVQEYTAILSYQ